MRWWLSVVATLRFLAVLPFVALVACSSGRSGPPAEPSSDATLPAPAQPDPMSAEPENAPTESRVPGPEAPASQLHGAERLALGPADAVTPAPGTPVAHVPTTPASTPRACIETADHGCLLPSVYPFVVKAIARRHEQADDYARQWGLAAINAAEAYARLVLAEGIGTVAGTGVTVGFVDSGIDGRHPLFTSDVPEAFLFSAPGATGAEF